MTDSQDAYEAETINYVIARVHVNIYGNHVTPWGRFLNDALSIPLSKWKRGDTGGKVRARIALAELLVKLTLNDKAAQR